MDWRLPTSYFTHTKGEKTLRQSKQNKINKRKLNEDNKARGRTAKQVKNIRKKQADKKNGIK